MRPQDPTPHPESARRRTAGALAPGGASGRHDEPASTDEVAGALIAQLQADPAACAHLVALLAGGLAPRTCHTTASLAAELGTSERTVRRAVAAGELVASRRAGRWVMTVEDVRDWLDRGRRSCPARRVRPAARGPRRGTMASALREH